MNYIPIASVKTMIDRYNNLCDEVRLLAKTLPTQGETMQTAPFVRELERMLLRAGTRMTMPEGIEP